MSEDEKAGLGQHEEDQDEVEAHKRAVAANEESSSEDDEVEAHRHAKGKHAKF